MKGWKVQCPNCKRIMHETTDKYNPDVRPNGSMVKLLEPWASQHWDTFDDGCLPTAGTSCALMNCPACAGALAPSGRLKIVEHVCAICGRPCKSELGLASHKRSHERKVESTENTPEGS